MTAESAPTWPQEDESINISPEDAADGFAAGPSTAAESIEDPLPGQEHLEPSPDNPHVEEADKKDKRQAA